MSWHQPLLLHAQPFASPSHVCELSGFAAFLGSLQDTAIRQRSAAFCTCYLSCREVSGQMFTAVRLSRWSTMAAHRSCEILQAAGVTNPSFLPLPHFFPSSSPHFLSSSISSLLPPFLSLIFFLSGTALSLVFAYRTVILTGQKYCTVLLVLSYFFSFVLFFLQFFPFLSFFLHSFPFVSLSFLSSYICFSV